MIFSSFRRLSGLLVLGFAAMGFVAVPIFDKTALQHVTEFVERPDVQEMESRAEVELEALGNELSAEFERQRDEKSQTTEHKDEPVLNRRKERALLLKEEVRH